MSSSQKVVIEPTAADVHEELPPMLQIEKPSNIIFWGDKLITNGVISKKIGENVF